MSATRRASAGTGPAAAEQPPAASGPLTKQEFAALARFRFGIRRYLRFSEETVRQHGVTPQQYQLMLALKAFPDRNWAVMRELADRLQLRHHSVVELVNRAQREGLVGRTADPDDARAVRVVLTENGQRILDRLSALHRDQLRRMNLVLTLPRWTPPAQASQAAPPPLQEADLVPAGPPAGPPIIGPATGEARRPAAAVPERSGDPARWPARVCPTCGRITEGEAAAQSPAAPPS